MNAKTKVPRKKTKRELDLETRLGECECALANLDRNGTSPILGLAF